MTFFKAVFYFIILILPTHAFANTLSLSGNGNNNWSVNYISDTAIAGFQFIINDSPDYLDLIDVSGGTAENYNFTFSPFSFTSVSVKGLKVISPAIAMAVTISGDATKA